MVVGQARSAAAGASFGAAPLGLCRRAGVAGGITTIHRQGRTTRLQSLGSRKPIALEAAQAICEDMDLDWKALPGPASRV